MLDFIGWGVLFSALVSMFIYYVRSNGKDLRELRNMTTTLLVNQNSMKNAMLHAHPKDKAMEKMLNHQWDHRYDRMIERIRRMIRQRR